MADEEVFDVFDEAARMPPGEALVVDLDGYEGPLDVLLGLARDQKVDLARISILQLADQYLEFVAAHLRDHLELAADYLVMAAWLAYLKSRLLLPVPPAPDEPSGEELAAALAFQLLRLEAMRKAGKALTDRPHLGRDLFGRGAPEGIARVARPVWDVGIYDLLKAYADIKKRGVVTRLQIEAPDLYSVDDAIQRLQTMLGRMPRWATLMSFLPPGLRGLLGRSALSAHFVATLELCRQGKVEVRQDEGVFGPIWVRTRRTPRDDGEEGAHG
ncbi:segregation and condensation protein A [Telmatospirillum siberiense]|uniref:Segregation and condensation protein A n=1 Tax=Telmatospirillum siberiense TaxID=382514 RepID=A0A2N3PTF5_9PROT|nr:ScpA family protein [Telmatospirillum siberiense]PKU23677.1 segregation/condensation protein A [Telmatospirillum siberiense]